MIDTNYFHIYHKKNLISHGFNVEEMWNKHEMVQMDVFSRKSDRIGRNSNIFSIFLFTTIIGCTVARVVRIADQGAVYSG
jgi:sensor histidine kinase YesM